MAKNRRTLRGLAALLPAGALGLSIGLAAADASAKSTEGVAQAAPASVALRLQAIRNSVSEVLQEVAKDPNDPTVDRETQLAWWGNGGWRNGGWGNGGWHNWGNGGWHNWGNGGWGNGGLIGGVLGGIFGGPGPWGNGWHNWGNGWHNW